jgi:hypothetical protein
MRLTRTRPRALAIVVLVVAVAGCGGAPGGSPAQATPSASVSESPGANSAVLWPAPPDPMARTVAAGLKPGPKEYLTNHFHAHLDVFVDGKPITVPAGIGININDPAVRRGDEPDGSVSYGGIDLCNEPCISPLHTHQVSGIIHSESSDPTPHTLGQFFIEWGVALSETCVADSCSQAKKIAFYVNGEPFAGDPRAIELTDQKEIAIVIGTPPAEIPKTADFSRP